MFKTLGDDKSGHVYKLDVEKEIPSSVNEKGYKVAPKVVIYEGYRDSIESAYLSLHCAHDNFRNEMLTYIEYGKGD